MHYDCYFGGQIRTRAVSAKQMTMVSPIQLLLFASRTVTAQGPNLVQLDNWSVTLSLSVCLSVCLPVHLPVCWSICLSICSLHPALSQHRVPAWCSWITAQSCCLSVRLLVCLSALCIPRHHSTGSQPGAAGQPVSYAVCLSVHPSVCPSTRLSALCILHCHST